MGEHIKKVRCKKILLYLECFLMVQARAEIPGEETGKVIRSEGVESIVD